MTDINVAAFIDWKSQIYNAAALAIRDPIIQCRRTLEKSAQAIITTLSHTGRELGLRFTVNMKLYHGWHRGFAPTPNRQALRQIENDPEFSLPRSGRDVRFNETLLYGEVLTDVLPNRFLSLGKSAMAPINLPNTYRPPISPDHLWREKMVDTALVCDVHVPCSL